MISLNGVMFLIRAGLLAREDILMTGKKFINIIFVKQTQIISRGHIRFIPNHPK
jgi:hypothetical protein